MRDDVSVIQMIGELLIGKRSDPVPRNRLSLDGMLMAWIARAKRPQKILCHPTSLISFRLTSSIVASFDGSVGKC